jgi:hypothetical protein
MSHASELVPASNAEEAERHAHHDIIKLIAVHIIFASMYYGVLYSL